MEILRHLGPNEKWYWISDSFSSSNISALLSWDSKISQIQIKEALIYCQEQIEVLSCVVDQTHPEKPRWIRPKEMPLVSVIWEESTEAITVTPERLYHMAEKECGLRILAGSTLFKCRVFQSATSTGIVLTTPHYVADGFSLHTLASVFNLGLNSEHSSGLDQTYPLTETLETLFPESAKGALGMLKWIGQQIKNFWFEFTLRPFRIKPVPILELENRKSRFNYFEAGDDLSKKVFNYMSINRKDFTINDLLMAVFARSLSKTLKVSAHSMAIGCPINLSARIQKKNLFGPSVSAHLSYVRLRDKSLRETIMRLRKSFKIGLKGDRPFLTLKPLSLITRNSPKDSKEIFKKVTKFSPGCITISNMGKLSPPSGVSFLGFAGSLNVSGYLMLGCYTFQDERLRFTSTWVEGAITDEQMKELISNILHDLESFVTSQN